MTLEEFKAKYPEIAQAVHDEGQAQAHEEGFAEGLERGIERGRAEGREEALEEGAKKERDRIQGVEAQLIPGHEKLINDMKFDGRTTGEQAAVKILQAERELRRSVLDKLDNDAVSPAPHSPAPEEGAQDFEQLVAACMDENHCSRARAVRVVALQRPDLHSEYIEKVNIRK